MNSKQDGFSQIPKYAPLLCAILGPIIPIVMLVDSTEYLGRVNDYSEYFTASWMVNHGLGGQVYDLKNFARIQLQLFPELNTRIVGFYLTPLALPMVVLLSIVPISFAYNFWISVLVLSILVSVFFLSKILKLSFDKTLMLWAFISLFGPVYESLRLGQIGPLLLLSYIIALLYSIKKKEILCGLFLAPFLAKPHLLFPLVFMNMGGKRYRSLTSLGVLAVVLLIVSMILVGVEGWQNYFELLKTDFLAKDHFTPTVRDQLRMLFPQVPIVLSQVSMVLYAVLMGGLFFLGRKLQKRDDFVFLAAIVVMPVALIFSPYVQFYDWLLIIPSVSILFVKGYSEKINKAVIRILFVCLAVLFLPFSALIHYYYLLAGGVINPSFIVGLFYSIVAIMVVLKTDSDPGT